MKTYVLHPCLVYAVGGIQQIELDRVRAAGRDRYPLSVLQQLA